MYRNFNRAAFAVACACAVLLSSQVSASDPSATLVTVPAFKKADEVKKSASKEEKSSSNRKSKKTKTVKSRKERSLRQYAAYKSAHSRVSTSCFPNRLRSVLRKVKTRYGVTPIVSSGYRSRKYNRRVGGARRSLHMQCKAADIRVPGVSKYRLARYLKSVSGVGGVGTYGCNSAVHVDIGPKRNWHWRCRRRG